MRSTISLSPDALADIHADLADLSDKVERLEFDLSLSEPIDGDLERLSSAVGELFHRAPDIILNRFRCRGGLEGLAVFDKVMTDPMLLVRGIFDRLADATLTPADGRAPELLRTVSETVAPPKGPVKLVATLGEVAVEALDGSAVIAFAGGRQALAIKVEKLDKRGIDRPVAEQVILGPQEGFIENAETNLSLVRRRLHTPRLWIEQHHIGTVSRTAVYVLHLHGIADDLLVAEVGRRLRRIDIDGVLDINQIKEQIRDSPSSPFPTTQRTERPERVAAALLEGRVAIIADGSPFAMIVPTTFTAQMKSAEDYYLHWTISSAIRVVRWMALLLGLVVPALYVAVATYHQEFIPTPLLVILAAARENAPLPTLAEVLALIVLFEIIREASARVPQAIGGALTIGGTLVIGQAIVRAGLISAPIIIVTGTVAIAFFAVPNYEIVQTARLILYPLLLAAGIMGIYGLFFAAIGIFLHLASLRSFGVPYLDPIAPLRPANWKDFVVRAPWWRIRTRPLGTGYTDPRREGRGVEPHPPRRRP